MASSERRKISSAISNFTECIQTQLQMMEGGHEKQYRRVMTDRCGLILNNNVLELLFHI